MSGTFGGGIAARNAQVSAIASSVENNAAISDGGGIHLAREEAPNQEHLFGWAYLTLTDTEVSQNIAGAHGGGAYIAATLSEHHDPMVAGIQSSFINNDAGGQINNIATCGVYLWYPLEVPGHFADFDGCELLYHSGAAITANMNTGAVTISDTLIGYNSVGILYKTGVTLTLSNITWSYNGSDTLAY